MTLNYEPLLRNCLAELQALGRIQLTTFGAKTLPLLLAVCAPTRGRVQRAAAWLFATVVTLVLLGDARWLPQVWTALAVLGYYAVTTRVSYSLIRGVGSGLVRKDVLICLLLVGFMLAPAAVLRRVGNLELLVLGWTIGLSVYSCCMEANRTARDLTPRQFLFFVLIDPTISFPDRAQRVNAPTHATLLRVAQGLALMILGQLLLAALQRWFDWLALHGHVRGPFTSIVLGAPIVFFIVYWVRAGAAHVRIGLMQALGFQPGECFKRPYLATSPRDFWLRWNCWVGDWVRRYLFFPLSLALSRRGKAHGITESVARALAVLGSFIAMGLLHDVLDFAGGAARALVFLRVFLFGATALLVWEAFALRQRRRAACRGPEAVSLRWAAKLGAAAYVSIMIAITGRI